MLVKLVGLVLASLALSASAASAAVTVSVTEGELTVIGSSGRDTPWIDYVPSQDRTRVFNADGVADPIPAECERPLAGQDPAPNGIPQDPSDVALCGPGGSATFLGDLVLDLGDGNDEPDVNECFNTVIIDLGEGNNSAEGSPCNNGVFG